MDFVKQQHNAANAREALRTCIQKYIASKYGNGDGEENVASTGEITDPLAAMGFKGKAKAPIPAPSPPRPAAAPAAASPRSNRGDDRGPTPPNPGRSDGTVGTPSSRRRAAASSASPSQSQVSPFRIFSAYQC